MKTVFIALKKLRDNLGKIIEKSKKENINFIVLKRNKPIAEFRPCMHDSLEIDQIENDYYLYLDKNLDFWHSSKDDNIFKD